MITLSMLHLTDLQTPQSKITDTLSLVCVRWRRIVLGCASLWSWISISDVDHNWTSIAASVLPKRVRVSLERSEITPLQLSIRLQNGSSVPGTLLELKDTVFRWQSLRITTFGIDASIVTLASFPPAPQLQLLDLSETYHGVTFHPDVYKIESLFSSGTTALSAVFVNGSIVLPWTCPLIFSGLVELSLHFVKNNHQLWQPSFCQMVSILETCPQLIWLSVGAWYPERPQWPISVVALPFLEAALFGPMHPECASEFLEHIQASNLKHLALDFDPPEMFDTDLFSQTVSRILEPEKGNGASIVASIESLELSSFRCDFQSARKMLAACGAVTKLIVRPSSSSQNWIIEAATRPSSDGLRCPEFSAIEILPIDDASRHGILFHRKSRRTFSF